MDRGIVLDDRFDNIRGLRTYILELIRELRINHRESETVISLLEEALKAMDERAESRPAPSGSVYDPQNSKPLPELHSTRIASNYKSPGVGDGGFWSDGPASSHPRLHICCLGKFQVKMDDRPLQSWRRNIVDGILKLLLVHLGHSLPRTSWLKPSGPTETWFHKKPPCGEQFTL
jgi:hypothetical protein